MSIESKNPATLETIKAYKELSDELLDEKLKMADGANIVWRETAFEERAKLLMKLADYLKEHKSKLGTLAMIEMGKTLIAAESEIEKSALTCEFFAENGEKFLTDEIIDTVATESYVHFDPLGTVLAIMPWNYPFWQVYRLVSQAIMAGNTVVLKHASNVQGCAEAIEKSFLDCGFPVGVFQNLCISSEKVEKVIRNNKIAGIAFTGSSKTGAIVASIAGSEIKKTVLELGGSDPFIVLKDADIELAAQIGFTSRLASNAGQACTSAKRFIVQEEVMDEFTEKFIDLFAHIVVGNGGDERTTMGPLAKEKILINLKRQVEESIKMGAKIIFEGKIPNLPGYFFPPMILSGVTKGMPLHDEEIFGPVASIISFKDEGEAVALANDSAYGRQPGLPDDPRPGHQDRLRFPHPR